MRERGMCGKVGEIFVKILTFIIIILVCDYIKSGFAYPLLPELILTL